MDKKKFGPGAGQPGQQIQLDLKKTTPVKCDCGNDIFMSVMKFRLVPKLLAGSKEDQLLPIQVFTCTSCGNIPTLLDANFED